MDGGSEPSTHKPRTLRDRINSLALDLLRHRPEGVRYSELVRGVMTADSSLNLSTVAGYISTLDQAFPGVVSKPTRGVFKISRPTLEKRPGQSESELRPQASMESRKSEVAPDSLTNESDRFHSSDPTMIGVRDGLSLSRRELAETVLGTVLIIIVGLLVGLKTGYVIWARP